MKVLLVVRWPVGGIRTYLKYMLNDGALNQHEYTTIKSCLLGAHKTQPEVAVAESFEAKYEQFLEQFDIL